MESIPLKGKPSEKLEIEWCVAYPLVSFIYRKMKGDDDCDVYIEKIDYAVVMKQLGLKKVENDYTNIDTLVNTISKIFNDKKVTIESSQNNYVLELKGGDNKTLLKANLKLR